MALTAKQYLDKTGLQAYDALIKNWANSAKQKGYKTILKTADGNTLNLYLKENATLTDKPDATVALGGGDVQTQLNALASIVGVTYDSDTQEYSAALDSTFNAAADDLVKALNELKGQINILNGSDTTAGSVAKAVKDALDSLADVATSGAASDVSVTTITGVTGTNVQAALASLKDLIDDANDAGVVTLAVAETPATGMLKTYVLSQGTGDDATEIGKIDIPKDYLVKSGRVVKNPEGQPAGTYIELVLNTKDDSVTDSTIYINVAGLVDIYTGAEDASEVQITVSDYVISASVVDIDASKITYIAANAKADPAVARESVKAALQRLDAATGNVASQIEAAINALDADLDAVTDATVTDQFKVAVVTGVTEVHGVITAVDSIDVDKAGAATAAYDAIGAIATTDINALFA